MACIHPVSQRRPGCLTNNVAERNLHGALLGKKAWLFAGSDKLAA
ncbi:hypothetical protein EBE87_26855 [Pseudoroseomonas wenyumeiae]|uniref:Transposase n=1 Tax=Teichococcus wenyumeiae TaxID=2478470 RepID=A0A3A9J5Z4_9PROT|nr:hypothetical protein D6Z83_22785 [Pseudoroseomonas wenyumeiae]RMI15196.1 hypothetical protein EBE87_26855 [Pseudoroseomonas wenyumeiae]